MYFGCKRGVGFVAEAQGVEKEDSGGGEEGIEGEEEAEKR